MDHVHPNATSDSFFSIRVWSTFDRSVSARHTRVLPVLALTKVVTTSGFLRPCSWKITSACSPVKVSRKRKECLAVPEMLGSPELRSDSNGLSASVLAQRFLRCFSFFLFFLLCYSLLFSLLLFFLSYFIAICVSSYCY